MKLELFSASAQTSGLQVRPLVMDEIPIEMKEAERPSWSEVIYANNPTGNLPEPDMTEEINVPAFTLGMLEHIQRWYNRAVPRSVLYDQCRNTLHFYSDRGITWRNTSDTPQWHTQRTQGRRRRPYRLRMWMSRSISFTRAVLRKSSFASQILPPMRVTSAAAVKLPPAVS